MNRAANYSCRHCGWSGAGADVVDNSVFYVCPSCQQPASTMPTSLLAACGAQVGVELVRAFAETFGIAARAWRPSPMWRALPEPLPCELIRATGDLAIGAYVATNEAIIDPGVDDEVFEYFEALGFDLEAVLAHLVKNGGAQ
jgi:hypothetical protein